MRWMLMAAVIAASPVAAQKGFQAYEGPDAETVGQGGTKVTENGIDYWTSGSPPRRFRLLGVFIDNRGAGPLGGNVVGSKSLAKRVKAVGGDAVIVGGSKESVRGAQSIQNMWTPGGTQTIIQRQVRTQVFVVKYLG